MITTSSKNRLATAAVLAAVACAMSACAGSTSSAPATTAGGGATATPASDPSPTVAPVTLRLGTDDGDQMPGAGQLQHFAQEVARLSDGAITIQPVYHADHGQPHWDQAVAHLLIDGQLDLAMVPSRAWDDLGVHSLQALTAPFLVTSDTLTEKVVTDPHLVEQLTSGLPDVGVSALGLFPEGLRHPFGFAGPLRGAQDYRGGVVRAAFSRGSQAMFAALGATMTDEEPDTSTMTGAESSYRLSPAGEATGNVTFYPKVNVLAIDADARQRLDADQLGVLQAAADATQAWVLQTLPSDADAAATFCSEAGKIGSASPAQVESLVQATRGVVQDLRQDATTASLIDEIGTLAQNVPAPEPVTGCPQARQSDVSFVDGRYAFTMPAAAVEAAGVTDQGLIDENAGSYVITLAGGSYSIEQVYSTGAKKGTTYHGSGGYQVTGRTVTWFWGHEPGQWTKVDVAVGDDGSLSFSHVEDGGDAQAQALSDAFFTRWPAQDG